MELRQLEYFIAVAEEANFTRAAARVHISQSGVSAQIRQLERELGAPLIDRSGRAATLTMAGAAALGPARAALAAVDAVSQAVDEVAELVRGHLGVGMVTGCTIAPLFEALAGFHHDHPGVDLTLSEGNSAMLVEEVRGGRLDVALIATAGAPPAGLEAMPIVTEQLVAAVPVDHRLARRRRVTLAELAECAVVCLPEGTGIRTAFDQGCAAAGISVDISFQASAPDAVADLARRGLGIAILSTSMVSPDDGRLRPLAITDLDIPAVLALIWSSSPNPARRELVRHCRRAFT